MQAPPRGFHEKAVLELAPIRIGVTATVRLPAVTGPRSQEYVSIPSRLHEQHANALLAEP